MKHAVRRAVLAIALTLLAQACAGLPGPGPTSASDIARDAAALNDAYSRAASGQILLNVLRARDRWPRQYVTLNGVTNQPTSTVGGTITLDPLPLGASNVLDGSNAELSRERTSNYNYGVTPLDTSTINSAVMQPVGRRVFAHYWESSWSEDIILQIMASGMRRYMGGAELNEAALRTLRPGRPGANWGAFHRNSLVDDEDPNGAPCAADLAYAGDVWPASAEQNDRCAFFRIVHRMLDHIILYGPESVRLQALPDAQCRESASVRLRNAETVASMAAAAEASGGRMVMQLRRPQSEADNTPPRSVVLARCPADSATPVLLQVMRRDTDQVAATYLVSLRSLDDMIYSVGALLRPEPMTPLLLARSQPCGRAAQQREAVGAIDLALRNGQPRPLAADFENCIKAPLFIITEASRGANPINYAAYVDYRGERVLAGPPVRRATLDNNDRTATVLTLLSQLFALNFSPGAEAAAPSRVSVVN